MSWWVEAKKAERMVDSRFWLYTGRTGWKHWHGNNKERYFELIPNLIRNW